MKEKIKEYKRKLLKKIQAKLRQFLNAEYRTSQEIEIDKVNSYIAQLKLLGEPFLTNNFVGEIHHLKGSDGITYYKNNKTGCWVNSLTGEDLSEDQLKEIMKQSKKEVKL